MVTMAVVGVTGLVGREVLELLESRNFPLTEIRLFASASSHGKQLSTPLGMRRTRVLTEHSFKGVDIAIFSAGSKVSREWARVAAASGCVVIDNSSAFRMDPMVPLVVPEINGADIEGHSGIIANPNCTTAIVLMALWALHQAFGAQRVSVTSYQAASGAGAKGLIELRAQLAAYARREQMQPDVFPYPIALNVFPHIGTFQGSSTDEELKVLNEGRKIMGAPQLRVSTTCGRVCTERVHCMDVLAQFDRPISLEQAYEALRGMPGLDVFDGEKVPTPLEYEGKWNCAVGRLRIDDAFENALRFWALGDQLLKGAALNAVQIAELVLKRIKK